MSTLKDKTSNKLGFRVKRLKKYWKSAEERKTYCTLRIHNMIGNLLAIKMGVKNRLRESNHQELIPQLEKELKGLNYNRAYKTLDKYVQLV